MIFRRFMSRGGLQPKIFLALRMCNVMAAEIGPQSVVGKIGVADLQSTLKNDDAGDRRCDFWSSCTMECHKHIELVLNSFSL